MTYGAAGDRDGNGWWAQMAIDTIGRGDIATGKVDRSQAAVDQGPDGPRRRRRTRAFYENFNELALQHARCRGRRARAAWAPTRTPTCCGSAIRGARASPASTPRRCETTIIPFPDTTMQPYHIAVDRTTTCGATCGPRIGSPSSIRAKQVDDVRPAGARHRNPPHLAARARRHDQGDRAGLPRRARWA